MVITNYLFYFLLHVSQLRSDVILIYDVQYSCQNFYEKKICVTELLEIKIEKWNRSKLPMHLKFTDMNPMNSSKVKILFHLEIWGLKAGFGPPGPKRLTKP